MAEKKKSAMNVPLRPLDNLFEPTIKEASKDVNSNTLAIGLLHSFKGHPFKMYTEERMAEMVDMISCIESLGAYVKAQEEQDESEKDR